MGTLGSEVMSLAGLKNAHHALPLAKESQWYCGITLYCGLSIYIYQRLGMKISVLGASRIKLDKKIQYFHVYYHVFLKQIFQKFYTTTMTLVLQDTKVFLQHQT